jgi:Flp pilus assembly protein CpaB
VVVLAVAPAEAQRLAAAAGARPLTLALLPPDEG